MFSDDVSIRCDDCGCWFEGEGCPQCEEFNIPEGAECEWCDLPAEYLVGGEFACEYHHEMAYPID